MVKDYWLALIGPVALSLSLSACSVNVLPVNAARLASAQRANEPIVRGAKNPASSPHAWQFNLPTGYLFDPTQLVFIQGGVRTQSTSAARPAAGEAYLQTRAGLPYVALDGFSVLASPDEASSRFKFQLSNGGGRWFYHDGKTWVPGEAKAGFANSADELNRRVPDFAVTAGQGELYVRVFFPITDPTAAPVVLKQVTVTTIAPRVDGWE